MIFCGPRGGIGPRRSLTGDLKSNIATNQALVFRSAFFGGCSKCAYIYGGHTTASLISFIDYPHFAPFGTVPTLQPLLPERCNGAGRQSPTPPELPDF